MCWNGPIKKFLFKFIIRTVKVHLSLIILQFPVLFWNIVLTVPCLQHHIHYNYSECCTVPLHTQNYLEAYTPPVVPSLIHGPKFTTDRIQTIFAIMVIFTLLHCRKQHHPKTCPTITDTQPCIEIQHSFSSCCITSLWSSPHCNYRPTSRGHL